MNFIPFVALRCNLLRLYFGPLHFASLRCGCLLHLYFSPLRFALLRCGCLLHLYFSPLRFALLRCGSLRARFSLAL